MNLDDKLAAAALAEHTEKVCLNSKLMAELAVAERLAVTAETASKARAERDAETAANRREVRKYREAADALRAQVDEQAVELHFRALPFPDYNQLVIDHPPRQGDKGDGYYGFNVATMFPALVRACLVDPDLSDEQWERLLAVLNDVTWDRVARAALQVNRGEDARVPF